MLVHRPIVFHSAKAFAAVVAVVAGLGNRIHWHHGMFAVSAGEDMCLHMHPTGTPLAHKQGWHHNLERMRSAHMGLDRKDLGCICPGTVHDHMRGCRMPAQRNSVSD